MVVGYNVRTSTVEQIIKEYNFNRHLYPEFYDCYNVDEIIGKSEEYKKIKRSLFNEADYRRTYSCGEPV